MKLRLCDLAHMHPSLLWVEIAAATAAVLDGRGFPTPYQFPVDVYNLPEFGTGRVNLEISRVGISADHVLRLRRTWDSPRLVELAAIAIAGLALFAAGATKFAMSLFAARRRITWSMQIAICWRSPVDRGESTLTQHGRSAGSVSWSVPAPGFTFAFVSSKALPPDWPLLKRKLP